MSLKFSPLKMRFLQEQHKKTHESVEHLRYHVLTLYVHFLLDIYSTADIKQSRH